MEYVHNRVNQCCFWKVLWLSDWKPSGSNHSSYLKWACNISTQRAPENREKLHSPNVQAGASVRGAGSVCFHNVSCFSNPTWWMIWYILWHMIWYMIWCMIWFMILIDDMIDDMIDDWHMIWYDKWHGIWYDMWCMIWYMICYVIWYVLCDMTYDISYDMWHDI